jgi:hypothetical protein
MQPSALRPEKRELVFDIDMTDYDEIRTCCQGGAICVRCWGYIAAAVKVLDHSLRGKSIALGETCHALIHDCRTIWLPTSTLGLFRSARNSLLDIRQGGARFER